MKKSLKNNKFEELANISIASLDSKSLQMYFKRFGFISILNVAGVNEKLSFAKYSELSNLKCMCRGLILENQLASPLSRTSAPPSIEESEESLNMAYQSTCHDHTNQRQCTLVDLSQEKSFFENLLELAEYFATDDFASRLNEIPRNELDRTKTVIPGFMEHICDLIMSSQKQPSFMNIILDTICRFVPHVFYCLFAAHLARHYYVTGKDYKRSGDICDETLKRFEEFSKLYDMFYYPVLLSNKLSGIYDDMIQSIIGFFTLLKWQLKRMNESWCSGDVHEVLLEIPVNDLLRYIRDRIPVEGQTSPRKFEIIQLKKLLLTLGESFHRKYMDNGFLEHYEQRTYTER